MKPEGAMRHMWHCPQEKFTSSSQEAVPRKQGDLLPLRPPLPEEVQAVGPPESSQGEAQLQERPREHLWALSPACWWVNEDACRQVPLPQEAHLWRMWRRFCHPGTVERPHRKWAYCWGRILPWVNCVPPDRISWNILQQLIPHISFHSSALLAFPNVFYWHCIFILTWYWGKTCFKLPSYDIYLQLHQHFISTITFN